jgi:Ca2+-binding RTX toxin-like protein
MALTFTLGAQTTQQAITDTQFNDIFTPQSATFITGTPTAGGTITYGITGVTAVGGIATKVGTYGTLTVNVTSGQYTFTPNDAAIEPLDTTTTTSNFSVFVTETNAGVPTTTTIGALPFEITVLPLLTAGDTTGADTITGTTGADIINALAGNDSISGAGGADSLSGGAGDDTYVLAALSAGTIITEALNEGTDLVQSAISYTLTANVENLNLMVTALTGTGNELDNVLTADFSATTSASMLIGGAGNDTLLGNSITGVVTGIDTLVGGTGDDSYTLSSLVDTVVTELTGEGWDAATTTVAGTMTIGVAAALGTITGTTATTLAANVEVLIIGAGATDGTGNGGNNFLLGNTAANNLDGAIGADVMAGYAGNDTYFIDNIGDAVVENANEGTDLVFATFSATLGANVENLTFVAGATGALAFEATGNTLDNAIVGNEFNNVLNGGAGVDAMTGGNGNDFYFVDNLGDTVTEAASEGTDLVYSTAASTTLSLNVENLVVWGTTGISGAGNVGNNIIYGQSLNNTLSDGAGKDVLVGGRGQDTYNLTADTTTDTVYVAAGDSLTTGFDIVNGFALGGANSTLVDNINVDSTAIAANVSLNNGTDAGAILTNSVANGIITFQGAGGVAINTANLVLSDAIAYVQANITNLETVAFLQGADTYVFQDGGINANDTLIDLVGVAATSVGTSGGVVGAVWII